MTFRKWVVKCMEEGVRALPRDTSSLGEDIGLEGLLGAFQDMAEPGKHSLKEAILVSAL